MSGRPSHRLDLSLPLPEATTAETERTSLVGPARAADPHTETQTPMSAAYSDLFKRPELPGIPINLSNQVPPRNGPGNSNSNAEPPSRLRQNSNRSAAERFGRASANIHHHRNRSMISDCDTGLVLGHGRCSIERLDEDGDDDDDDEEKRLLLQQQLPEKSKSGLLSKIAVIVGSLFAYTFCGFLIDFANTIPSVQFDFNAGTTYKDLFHPNTLSLRKRCGSWTRPGGGFEFRADEEGDSCWNGYLDNDVWKIGAQGKRKWVGWFKSAPMMHNLFVVVRVVGDIKINLSVTQGGKSQAVVTDRRAHGTVGGEAVETDPIYLDLASGDAAFSMDVEFVSEVGHKANRISVLYYVDGEDNRKRAVLLPFSEYTSVNEIREIAESESGKSTANAHQVQVHAPKGKKMVPTTVIFMWWFGVLMMNLTICACVDIYYKKFSQEEAPYSWLRACFEWRNILTLAPASIGWGLADICEVLALSKLDPVIYAIISQMRLLGAAACSTLILQRYYTSLQWMILSVLTLLVVSFSIMSAGDGASGSSAGYILCVLKAFFCVVSVVYAEKQLNSGADRSFMVQGVWISIVIVPTMGVSFLTLSWVGDLDIFTFGFFGGYDFGWDQRTVMLVLFYMYYSTIPTACVKVCSALTSKITNTASMILIFVFYLIIHQQKPEVLLCCSIGMTVGMYVMASQYTPNSKIKAKNSSKQNLN